MKKPLSLLLVVALILSLLSPSVFAEGNSTSTPEDTMSILSGEGVESTDTQATTSSKDDPPTEVKPSDTTTVTPAVETPVVTDDAVKPVEVIPPTETPAEEVVEEVVEEKPEVVEETPKEEIKEEVPEVVEEPVEEVEEPKEEEEVKDYVDKTKDVIKDGLHVKIRYSDFDSTNDYIPTFTIAHRNAKGKVISTVKAGPQNYNKELQEYNLVFKNPGYKLGEEYQLFLTETDEVITTLNMVVQYFKGDDLYTEETTLKKGNYFKFKVREVDYFEGAKEETAVKGLEPSKLYPLMGELNTSGNKVGLILVNEKGAPLKNETVIIRTQRNKEFKVTSNSKGVAWTDKKNLTNRYLVYSKTKDVAKEQNGMIELENYDADVQDAIITHKIVLKAKESYSSTTSILDVNVKVDGNTEFSNNWVNADIILKNAKGVETVFSVNGESMSFNIPNGKYSVTASSPYANVKLGATTLNVSNGKGSLSVSLSPKYTLEIAKEGNPYQFSVMNIASIADKTFTGTKVLTYGVVPGESYMVQDKDDNAVYTVVIDEASFLTRLVLGVGVVFGGSVSTPHTGDNIMFLIILFLVTVAVAGASFFIYRKNSQVKQVGVTFLLFMVLISSVLPANAGQVFADTGIGSGTPGSTRPGTVSPSGIVQASDTVSLLQVSFVKAKNGKASLNENSTKEDFNDPFKFQNTNLRNAFYMAPNKTVADLFKSSNSSFAMYDNGNVQQIYNNSPFKTSASDSAPKNRDKWGIKGTMGQRLLPLPEQAANSMNTFEAFMGYTFKMLTSDTSSQRNIWKGHKSSSKMNIGDAISTEYKKSFLALKNGSTNEQAMDEAMLNNAILEGYMSKLYEVGQGGEAERLYDSINRAEEGDYIFLFQVVQAFYVKGASPRKHTFMPMNDAVEWYLYGRKKESPTKMAKYTHLKEEQAVNVPNDTGNNTKWSYVSPTYSYVGNVRKTSVTAVKPKSKKVPISKPTTTPANITKNPYAGWGFVPWGYPMSYTAGPKLKVQLKIDVLDDNGKSTGKVVTKDVLVASPDEEGESNTSKSSAQLEAEAAQGKLGVELSSLRETGMIEGSTSVEVDGSVYDIPDQKDAKVTVIDIGKQADIDPARWGKESLLKQTKDGGFNLSTKVKGVSSLPISIPTIQDGKWSIIFDFDAPLPLAMHTYLGGDTDTKSDKNRYAGRNMDSDALMVLHVKAFETPFQPKEISNTMKVPEWRLSQYYGDISPKQKAKAGFSLSLPIGTFQNPSLTNSGATAFNLIDPNLSSTPWAMSKAKLFNDTHIKPINVNSTIAQFNLAGDLLAIKDNSTIGNVKLASWKNNFALYGNRIGVTSQGQYQNTPSVRKYFLFDYGVKSPYSNYTYSETRWSCNADDECHSYRWSGEAGQAYAKSKYNTTVDFSRYIPKDSAATKTFAKATDSVNGFYWETYQDKTKLNVNPEVLMAYDDTNGNTSVAFAAGDKLRQVQPVHYNVSKFVNVDIVPKVEGMSVATDQKAKQLASRLGAANLGVIYKGSAITTNFDVKGDLELKTYALDIGSSALKNAWGNTGYSTDKVNEEFLGRYATKGADGKWAVALTADGKLKINNKDYGGKKEVKKVTQTSKDVKEHTLVIRGGKLVSVNGNSNIASLPQEFRDALARMNISSDTGKNVFNTFERNKGSNLSEAKVASLANAMRGTGDLKVGSPWYQEDTTTMVVREYTNVFKLPVHLYVDKVPMEIPGLETPMDKMQFFSQGHVGHTKLKYSLVDSYMEFDSSLAKPFGGKQSKDYVVPNSSIMDNFQ